MKIYLNYEVWMKHLKKTVGVHFKNGDIVLLKNIFLHSEEILTFLKNFLKTI